MRYIRLKEDPLQIKSFGFVGPGGLGEFDTNLFDEVGNYAIRNKETGELRNKHFETSGSIPFDSNIEEEIELDFLPEGSTEYIEPNANGIDLIEYINKITVESLSDAGALELITKLQPLMIFLQQGRCNPMTKETEAFALSILDVNVENGRKDLLMQIINKWKKDKKFAVKK